MLSNVIQKVSLFSGFVLVSSALSAQVSFFQPPSYSGSGTLFTADFNGDGMLDLLSTDGTLELGNGNGTFTAGAPVTGQPAAVGDFNGDGKPDVLELGSNGTLLVLIGNGDGTFQAPISTASGAALGPVAAADLNGDGKTDVAGVFNNSLLVYLSKGDGTFSAGVPYNLGSLPNGAAIVSFGDFNGDGKTDILVSLSGLAGTTTLGQEIVLLGNGDGTFQAAKRSLGLYSPETLVTSDFNGDGKADLAINTLTVCKVSDCSSIIQGGVYLLAGNGDGTFQAPTLIIPGSSSTSSTYYPRSLVAADMNGDGKADLILEGSSTVGQVYLGKGDGSFPSGLSYLLSESICPCNDSGLVVADFNGDGKLDVAGGNAVLLGNGDGSLQGVPLGVITLEAFPSYTALTPTVAGIFDKRMSVPGVAAGDMELSGSVRINSVHILSNNGAGTLSLVNTYPIQEPLNNLVTADLNGDGNLDLLVTGIDPISQDWSYSVLLGNGDGTFQPAIYYPQNVEVASASAMSVVVADFNKDKKPDIAISGVGNQSAAILLGKGDGTFSTPAYVYDGGTTSAVSLVSADFNGDGDADLAVGVEVGTALLLGNGDGTFQAAVFPPGLTNFTAIYTADLNNDGKADLVSNDQVALGNGDGTFTVSPVLTTVNWIYGVADLNGDGIPDLIGDTASDSQYVGQTGVLLGNGDGTFGQLINVPASGALPSTLLLTDMNGDGKTDLVFPWTFAVSGVTGMAVVLNTSPPNFGLSAAALTPATVTAGSTASTMVTISEVAGTAGAVSLSCMGLPSGANCAFTPASITGVGSASALVISTTSSTTAGTYAIAVQGTEGSVTHQVALPLVVQAAPDFTITPPSTTSQNVSAGQSANFSLSFAPVSSFSGTVSLSCVITPAATPPPTCSLSSSSVQISGTTAQTVTVTVATTAPMTTAAVRQPSHGGFPLGSLPVLGLLIFLLRKRRRLEILAGVLLAGIFLSGIGCGSGGSGTPPPHTIPGTPAGTYTATVTATSGSLNHTTALQVVVQ